MGTNHKDANPMIDPFITVICFTFGLCIGSFLNVCIYRLPTPMSIVQPGSMCLSCKNKIRFYDNIPVISYLVLHGRCRQCGVSISFRYPLVEFISGLFAVCIYLNYGLTLSGLIYYVFIVALMVLTFIDIDHQILPDSITLPGIPIFFLASFVMPEITYKQSLLGLAVGGGILLLIGWVYLLLTRKEGMGGGDIKLLAMIGALLGIKGVFFTIFVASCVGTLVGLVLMLRSGKGMKLAVPFGPFLSIGAILYVFFGPRIIFWYLYL